MEDIRSVSYRPPALMRRLHLVQDHGLLPAVPSTRIKRRVPCRLGEPPDIRRNGG
jgi:hypothetical protein